VSIFRESVGKLLPGRIEYTQLIGACFHRDSIKPPGGAGGDT
jgi:hypothetical protein